MKRSNIQSFIAGALLLGAIFGTGACAQSDPHKDKTGKTPGQIEISVWQAVKEKKSDQAYELWSERLLLPDTLSDADREKTNAIFKVLLLGSEKQYEKKGGITSVELIDETYNPDIDTALVKTRIVFGNNDTLNGKMSYIRVDNRWMMEKAK